MFTMTFYVRSGFYQNNYTLEFKSEREAIETFEEHSSVRIKTDCFKLEKETKLLFTGNGKLRFYSTDDEILEITSPYSLFNTEFPLESFIHFLANCYNSDNDIDVWTSVPTFEICSAKFDFETEEEYENAYNETLFFYEIAKLIGIWEKEYAKNAVKPLKAFVDNFVPTVIGYQTMLDAYDEAKGVLEEIEYFHNLLERFEEEYEDILKSAL